jgi:hypothetical protein
MTKQVKTVIGFCPTHGHAEEVVDKLRLSGFRNTDVSALMQDGGDVAGGVLSWPAGSNPLKQEESNPHAEWIEQGGIVLYVRCSSAEWEKRAENVLRTGVAAAGAY